MEQNHPNWKNLPAEILYEIFRLVAKSDGSNTTRNFALVCKTWLSPAQSILYSRITINTLAQLQHFYNTVKNVSHLGMRVKTFNSEIDSNDFNTETDHANIFEMQDLLSKLLCTCLPKLEEFNKLGGESYLPVVDALQQSQLKYLKRLSDPGYDRKGSELANYVTCVMLMKDTIEKVRITGKDNTSNDMEANTFFNDYRIYNRLNEFTNLTILCLEKTTDNDIQVLEYVLQACTSLKELSFDFDPPNNDTTFPLQSNSNSIVDMSTFTPSLDVCNVECVVAASREYRNLMYIMHKFPNPQSFSLQMKLHNRVKLNHHILIKLLKYSDGIKRFQVSVYIDKDTISETMRQYWDVPEGHGRWEVKIMFKALMEENTCSIDITRNETCFEFCIKYSTSTLNLHYIDFIRKNGMFIKRLKLRDALADLSEKQNLPNDLMPFVITHCPYLETFKIDSCTIYRPLIQFNDTLDRKIPLNCLYLKSCDINRKTFEQLSNHLNEVKELRLKNCSNMEGQHCARILLKQTKIDRMVFEDSRLGQIVYIMLFITDRVGRAYFRFDKELKECTKEEYKAKNDDEHLYISCKNIPKFEFITRN